MSFYSCFDVYDSIQFRSVKAVICCSTINCNATSNRNRAAYKHRFVSCNLHLIENNDSMTMLLRFERTYQDSLSPVRDFEANSSEGYNSEVKTLSAISAI